MSDRTPAPSPKNATTRRALELDALSAILPMDRRDRLAEILTDDDVATLKHLAKAGMGENSLRALASDLAYLEAWALASTGSAPALAGARGAGVEIRRPSSLGSWCAGAPTRATACRPTLRTLYARKICCGRSARMRRRRCGGACRAGRPCIIGKASRGRSPRRRCARRCGFRRAHLRVLGRGRASAR